MNDVNTIAMIEILKLTFKDFILFLKYGCSKANTSPDIFSSEIYYQMCG